MADRQKRISPPVVGPQVDDEPPAAVSDDRPFVFVLMPFASEFDAVYKDGIKPAASDAGADCERVDEQIFADSILRRIYAEIARADLIVADMTGCDPNVFYEVGFAHALNKRVILVTQDASDIPFDVAPLRHIVYEGSPLGLRHQLSKSIEVNLSPGLMQDRSDVHVPKVKRFDTMASLYAHVVNRMRQSRAIDDLSWAKPEVQEKSSADWIGYKRYLATKASLCEQPNVTYREVFTFPTKSRLARALEHIDMKLYAYSASYYPIQATDRIPRFSFILFDAEEVVVFFYSGDNRSARTEIRLSISEPHLVAMFQDYYDHVFQGGVILKDADNLNRNEIERLRESLRAWVADD